MMKLQFLCPNHRSQLETNVTKAIQCWQTGIDTGQFYLDHRLWLDAVPHLGCAFETADILMSNKMIEYEVACEWFSQSSMLLSGAFTNLHHRAEAEEINWMTINRLEKELARQGHKYPWLKNHVNNQYQQLNNLLTRFSTQGQPAAKQTPLAQLH